MSDKHEHDYRPKILKVPLHRYNNKRKESGAMTGVDKISIWKCECGAYIAYDLTRTLA